MCPPSPYRRHSDILSDFHQFRGFKHRNQTVSNFTALQQDIEQMETFFSVKRQRITREPLLTIIGSY